jgi:hypothetical protein
MPVVTADSPHRERKNSRPMHAYVDESIRGRNYLLCAALVPESSVTELRRSLRGQLRGSQGRLHMAKEGAETKKRLLAHVDGLDSIAAIVAIEASRRSDRTARDACLRTLTAALLSRDLRRLVLESCDQDKQDRQVLGDALAAAGSLASVSIVHHRASDEPLLWLPDIIAWAYGSSGTWRARISKLPITEIRL